MELNRNNNFEPQRLPMGSNIQMKGKPYLFGKARRAQGD